jgi:hypothetical protein
VREFMKEDGGHVDLIARRRTGAEIPIVTEIAEL